MKSLIKNNKQSFILLISLVVGSIIGLIFKENCLFLKPFGDLFINLMFIIIVPLIFFTITTSIANIKKIKRLNKVLINTLLIFIITSIIAIFIGLITTFSIKLVDTSKSNTIFNSFDYNIVENERINILEKTINTISTNDFVNILSKEHLIALIVFSLIVGIALSKLNDETKNILVIFNEFNKLTIKIVDIVFLYAPIGLGCYFASLIGTIGNEIAYGYLKTFIVYCILALIYYFIVYSIYAFIAGKKQGLIKYWKNILPASFTAISTCSSAASIPINIKCSKNIGVSSDISETLIPLGTSFHKDGSMLSSVFKILFLAYLFNYNIFCFSGLLKIISLALISNLLVTAVPIGGGTISETLIITMMGFPLSSLPILTIIATIIDAPATLLNVTGDTVSSMLVARIVDGKNWLNKNPKISI